MLYRLKKYCCPQPARDALPIPLRLSDTSPKIVEELVVGLAD